MSEFNDAAAAAAAAKAAVDQVRVRDIHTHLFPPSHGGLLLWGIDELLTYHYLLAELFAVAPRELTPEAFWKLSKPEQADAVWEHVFARHGALSEAARGAITTLNALGLDVAGRDLAGIRGWFAEQTIEAHLPKVLELAGVDSLVMTNNPFAPEEATCWLKGLPVPDCMSAALRIDPLLCDWPAAAKAVSDAGFDAKADADATGFAAARRFLSDWAGRIRPVYLAASLPQDFAYPADHLSTAVLDEVVIPAAEELNLPIALMIGVRRGVNPALRDAGDCVGVADVEAVQNLCGAHPGVKFLVTMLSRINQHELCVLARKFGNLHLFGCWWFCNVPSIIDEITRTRLELLGATFTCQHSDARVLDQLIYKWSHTRKVVGDVLAQTYRDQFLAGWRPTGEEIRRDVGALFGGAFAEFLAK